MKRFFDLPASKRAMRVRRLRRHLGRVRRHPAGLPVAAFLALVLSSGLGLYAASRHAAINTFQGVRSTIVIVSHDGRREVVPTGAKTVEELLQKMDITLAKGDRVEPGLHSVVAQDNLLVNVYRSAPVAISDSASGASIVTKNAGATPRSIVAQSGLPLYAEDTVTAEPTSNFVLQRSLGERVTVHRATPLTLKLYGQELAVRTRQKTVAALLKEKNVELTSEDTVKPGLDAAVSGGMQVAVVRNGVQVQTVSEEVPAPVEYVVDTSLSFGSQAVRQEGSPGKVVKTYQVKVENGEEVSRVLMQSVTVSQPVKRVVAKGNTVNIPGDKQAVMAAAGISSAEYAYVDYIFSRESHWNAAATSSNGYYGLGQTSLGKISSACPNWQSDPVCQTRLFTAYAGRYGGWEGAYNFWLGHGWW